MKLLTMMFVAVCCSSFLTLVFTPTITTLKQKVEIKLTQAFASPGKNSSGDAEDQHEDDVDNIRMDKDGGEEALAGHEIADEEEGEGERPEQGEEEGQRRGGHRKVGHHLSSNSGMIKLSSKLIKNLPDVPKSCRL